MIFHAAQIVLQKIQIRIVVIGVDAADRDSQLARIPAAHLFKGFLGFQVEDKMAVVHVFKTPSFDGELSPWRSLTRFLLESRRENSSSVLLLGLGEVFGDGLQGNLPEGSKDPVGEGELLFGIRGR